MSARVRLPDLTGPDPTPRASGWHALAAHDVAVPSLEDARRCAASAATTLDGEPCAESVPSLDLPDDAVIVALGDPFVVHARVARAAIGSRMLEPALVLVVRDAAGVERRVIGERVRRTRVVRFEIDLSSTDDGELTLELEGLVSRVTLARGSPPALQPSRDPCAITLLPVRVLAERSGVEPSPHPRPPLLRVDSRGRQVAAWSLELRGHPTRDLAIVPRSDRAIDVLAGGALLRTIELDAPIRDAVLWPGAAAGRDAVALLTSDTLFACAISGERPVGVATIDDGIALAWRGESRDAGAIVVVQRGTTGPVALSHLRVVRPDGTELAPPAVLDGRGAYASWRDPAFVFDAERCGYDVDPSRVTVDCCAAARAPMAREAAAFFAWIDDLLRARRGHALEGTVVLGPADAGDLLDAGRSGERWHRVLLFGEIPADATIAIETRTTDDLRLADPLVDDGWSHPVVATATSARAVALPSDLRIAAADAMVLARPGRFLVVRLTLRGDGRTTPRITSIEIARPRRGIARFLPAVHRDSTPDDDFLRRWLALFETVAYDGLAARLREHPALFDPRTAPPPMLPFLAHWLQIPLPTRLRDDEPRLRRILVAAPEIAMRRGTPDGLRAIVRAYLDVEIQIRESFASASRFVLGGDANGTCGAVLGCHTILSAEPGGLVLGDEPRLGMGLLLACDERGAGVAHHFDVLVPAHALCRSEDEALLRELIDTEKPAHTTYRIIAVGAPGWVVGAGTIVGEAIAGELDPADPSTYGIVVGGEPARPAPLDLGFVLGSERARLHATPDEPRASVIVGRSSRVL